MRVFEKNSSHAEGSRRDVFFLRYMNSIRSEID
jgi:hypothetical protein